MSLSIRLKSNNRILKWRLVIMRVESYLTVGALSASRCVSLGAFSSTLLVLGESDSLISLAVSESFFSSDMCGKRRVMVTYSTMRMIVCILLSCSRLRQHDDSAAGSLATCCSMNLRLDGLWLDGFVAQWLDGSVAQWLDSFLALWLDGFIADFLGTWQEYFALACPFFLVVAFPQGFLFSVVIPLLAPMLYF